MKEAWSSFWRRHQSLARAKWLAVGLIVTLTVAAALVVNQGLRRMEPFLRARIIAELAERFHAQVELDSLHISLLHGISAEGKGLRIWPPAEVHGVALPEAQGEPLIRLAEFHFHAPLNWRPGKPITISLLALQGLSVHLPPRSRFQLVAAAGSQAASKPPSALAGVVTLLVEKIECTNAEIVMETDKPDKLPLEFAIAHIKLANPASSGTMSFDAELTNPKPEGTIITSGSIGPWHGTDLGEIPLAGDYRLEHAKLASFKEIAGDLNSTGHYQGTLRALTVDGETQTPDFRLTHFGNALPLQTRFHAQVDGTNGDTWLDPVEATLGHSHFTAQGAIVRVMEAENSVAPQSIGHDIALTVNVDKARIEDFLRLASRTETLLMTGDVQVKTKLHIPPGPKQVHERLQLNGWFALEKARFTSAKIQGRIAELSLRGQGRPQDVKTTDAAGILSQMQGSFQMAEAIITLPALEYTVPGAVIQLKGTYGVEGGALNFAGAAKLDAPISKVVGGWKGALLKPADRYFKRDGAGTEVFVHISGTRDAPDFGIDLERKKQDENP